MRAEGHVPEPAHITLWPGEFVNVRVLVQQQQQVLTMPASALQRGPDGLFAYVVQADSTVEVRPLNDRRATATASW